MTVVQAARYMGAEMKDEILTPADAGELVKANFAKIPNWFFDSVLPIAPSTFSCLLAFMLRKTVCMSGAKHGLRMISTLLTRTAYAANKRAANCRTIPTLEACAFLSTRQCHPNVPG